PDVAVMRCTQNRPELRQEQPRLGKAEAHRAQSQRRIRRDAHQSVETLLALVGAQVERANHHRFAAHSGSDLAVRLELLVLGRQSLTIEKQELAAEKADAAGAVVQRLIGIVGQLDVGEQLDVEAVDRGRARRLQALELFSRKLELALL